MSVPGGAESLKGSIVVLVVAVDMVAKVVSTEKKSRKYLMSMVENVREIVAAIYILYEKGEWAQ
jgi:hypothetical protein